MEKLTIPAPDEEKPELVFFETFGITLLMCTVFWWTAVPMLFLNKHKGKQPPAGVSKETFNRLRMQETAAKRAKRLNDQLHILDAQSWTRADVEAAVEHGHVDLSNLACEHVMARLKGALKEVKPWSKDDISALTTMLYKRAARRTNNTPMACLVRAWFQRDLTHKRHLGSEVAKIWSEVEKGETPSTLVAYMVKEFERTRNRPTHPRFIAWLRNCALRPGKTEWSFCVRILRQMSPAQGKDFLDMIDHHIKDLSTQHRPGTVALDEIGVILGRLVSKGQPDAWRVIQTKAQFNYNYDLRIGATFVLCRLLHSPDQLVSSGAIEGLGIAAHINALPTKTAHARWRTTCHMAFGGEHIDDKIVPPKLPKIAPLAPFKVWSGKSGEAPIYHLEDAVARQDCPTYEDKPSWYCGIPLWSGESTSVSTSLTNLHTKTRKFEWIGKEKLRKTTGLTWDSIKTKNTKNTKNPVSKTGP